MFWNGLNKTETFEKTQQIIHFDRFLVFSWNRSKILRNPICFEMDWIKQKISKRHKKLYILTDFSFSLEIDQNIKKSYMFWNGLNKTEIFEKTQKDIYSLCFFKTNGLLNGKSQEMIDFLQTFTMADFQKKIQKKSLKKL